MIERIIGFIIYIFSFLFVRNKNKWVFGSYGGFNDNSKYLFLYIIKNHPKIKAIWIYEKKHSQQFINFPFKAYYQWSIKGLYHCLTAKVYIFSAYSKEINFFTSGGAILFNLWHGIGIKKIEFLIDSGPLKKNFQFNLQNLWKYPWIFRKPDYVLSTSSYTSDNFFAPAFRIKKNQCIEIGYPRCDILFLTQSQIIQYVKQFEKKDMMNLLLKTKEYNEIYIYMPTWREDNKNFVVNAKIDFEKINELVRTQKSLFLIKLHVNSNLDLDNYSKLSNIIFLPTNLDVYPLLPFTTCLITDYSSVYFDYLLLKKRIILFPFDYEQYILRNRSMLFDYNDTMIGEKVFNFDSLLDCISKPKRKISYNLQIEKFWNNYHGNASYRCTEFLKKLLKIN
ncbi:MAG: CDP-glycerol glycerophosphotransferase family protein [Bacteroidales bacterium]|nr:CDP-glycerol glycerophosphotransferase family protein [Bacteroidales bacterium]